MTVLALIRHGETAWNTEGRIQGRADVSLSPTGIAELRALMPPLELADARWMASPMLRARQTADLLNGRAETEPRLIETNWAAWEGLCSTVTHHHAHRISARGLAGLDFRPPGGESPRDVQARLTDLFADLARSKTPVVGVTHKGVIRAALSLATGWDMLGKPPVKLKWRAAHLFRLAADGSVALEQPNLMLIPRA
jgi:probable phosphoglycerate mutase